MNRPGMTIAQQAARTGGMELAPGASFMLVGRHFRADSMGGPVSQDTFTVGQVARMTGLSGKAIRLYELRGLLPTLPRSARGYRLFDKADIEVLRFIRQARTIGLRLDEIAEVLVLQRSGHAPCERVLAMLDAHLSEIDNTLSDLYAVRSALAEAYAAAGASHQPDQQSFICQIIQGSPDGGPPLASGQPSSIDSPGIQRTG
jgi:MerR family transcriptional regulator, copper efflux regulator